MILNSPYITGSITVTGNTTIQGSLIVTGSLSGTASLASNSNLLQGTGSVGFATTASLLEVSSSQQQISSSQQQISSSLLTLTASYAALSSSYISLSASYNTFSGSASTRTTQIEQVYATTGSNSFRANQSITGSLVVSSTITAQTLVVQTVTSSIVYSSGSNLFGSALGDRQTFTGSVNITGSLTVNTTGTEFQVTNNGVVMGNLLTDAHRITGSLSVTGSTHTIFGNVGIGTADLGPDGLSLLANFNYAWSEGSGNAYATLFRQRNSAATVMASGYKRSNTGAFASSYGISMARAAIAIGSNNGSIAFFSDPSSNVANGTDITPSERVTILNSGNVGIGTTNPTYNLQVLNTIGLRANSVDFQAIKGTGFGYSPGSYKVVMLGTSASAEFTTVSIGYDPAGNANGSFNGSGIEVLFRRGVQFVTPNSANNNYYLTNLVLQDGNVAIGNTSPQASLHIGPSLNTVPASTSIAVTGDTAIRFMAGSDGNANYGSYIAGTQYSGVRALSLGYRQGAGDVLTMTVTQISDGIGGVGIGITNPAARLHVVGNQYIGKLGGGGNYKQTVVGQTTAAASGTSKKIAYVGFTHSVRVYVWANQNASNGSSAIADFTTLYGSSTGGTTSEASFGNVSDIVVAYDNGGSPAYTINVTLTYSGAAPTINYIVEGINHDNNIYTIA